MNCESILTSSPAKRLMPFAPQASAELPASSHLVGNRRETKTMLARPGDFTVSLEPLPRGLHGTEIGYAVSIRNTGSEPLRDLEIVETRICPTLSSESVVFSVDTAPICPGERRLIPRLNICPPGGIFIVTTVMARGLHAEVVYRSSQLELAGQPA